ncbi:MAG: ABC transporter ATP-binding protein/permease [Sphingopyxis sp.]|nr:ABC transporter ATP-binding protein/permease [Sphingopyxis sp.]
MIPEPQNVEEARREAGLEPPQPARERIAHAWKLSIGYFLSSDWKIGCFLLLCVAGFEVFGIYINVWLNNWQQHFYDSVQNKAAATFAALVLTYVGLMAVQVGYVLAKALVDWVLSMRWRRWLTTEYLHRWFDRDRYYEIERLRLLDNPDQRIAEDLRDFTYQVSSAAISPVILVIHVLTSIASAVTFAAIMMETARPIRFSLFGNAVSLPGDTIWYATLYVFVTTIVVTWVGKPVTRRQMRQQHYEANFRAGLLHVRRNGEQIAFAGTGGFERENLFEAFRKIAANWYRLMWATLGLSAFTNTQQRVMAVIPLFITIPRFFTGEISFGQVMAAQGAFVTYATTLSYIVMVYPMIARQVANINRIKALDDAIDSPRPRGIAFGAQPASADAAIVSRDLSLRRPNGEHLMTVGDWTVHPGERWMIEGPSGAGKTTLLRAVAGLWPDGSGEIMMAGADRAMMVPQRLYMPLGNLKDAVCFPDRAADFSDTQVAEILDLVRLGVHVSAMHEPRVLQEELSPGEQQRVALARILLHRPSLLVLDEATSALDLNNARHFHQAILEHLPDVTLVSVIHNDRLAEFYTNRLTLADGKASAHRVGAPT